MAGKGGAWKVAYADFVTAMMALFMVLWISAQDKEVLIATSRYFQSPFKSPLDSKSGLLQFESNKPANSKQSDDKTDQDTRANSDARSIDLQFLNAVAKDFYRLLSLDESLEKKPIDIQVTSDGLRITLYDRGNQPLFESASARFTKWGDFVMQSLSWLVDRNDFHVVIEGHTRSGLALPNADYTPWELSADRANSARRALVHYAVKPELIERVTGYADTRPVPLEAPDSESNQRVTLSLRLGARGADKKKTTSAAASAAPAPAVTPATAPAKDGAPHSSP